MKFALKDSMVERASGRTVEGGERSEVTELWTFMRAVAGFGCCRPSSRLDVRYNQRPRGRAGLRRSLYRNIFRAERDHNLSGPQH